MIIFRDALFTNRRNEPWWFKIIRRAFALSFIFLIMIYGITQFRSIIDFLYAPNILIVESKNGVNFPGFIICPKSSSNQLQVEPQFSITCGYSTVIGPEILSEDTNSTDNVCSSLISKAENGCLKFQPGDKYITSNYEKAYSDNEDGDLKIKLLGFNKTFLFFNIKPNIKTEIPLFYSLQFEDYVHRENDQPVYYSVQNVNSDHYIEYKDVLINPGQRNIIEYSIDIHRAFSMGLIGLLNIVPDLYSMEIKINTNNIPRKQQTMETQFVLLPKIPRYLRQEEEKFEYDPITFLSRIGGFHGAIMTIYVVLLGMPKIEPWGILQKSILSCWGCRKHFKHKLADEYNIEAGIPLADNIEDLPKEVSLEDRVQNMEYILKDHYLDSSYIELLKSTKLNYDYQENHYERLLSKINTPLTIQIPPVSPLSNSFISEKTPLSFYILCTYDQIFKFCTRSKKFE